MSDTSPFGFGRFVPGFDFLQNLAKGASTGMPGMPALSGWVAPTISVEELDKRIQELKVVQFWLEQNARALTATVQALEVQKMTLATLQGMNVAMGDLAGAFTTGRAASAAPQGAPAPARATAEPDAPPPSDPAQPGADVQPAPGGVVDPMQWWGALTSQFQQIAANAMKDVAAPQAALDATREMASGAIKTATDMAAQFAAQSMQGAQAAAAAVGAARVRKPAAPAKKAAASKTPTAKAAAKAGAAKSAAGKRAAPARAKAARGG